MRACLELYGIKKEHIYDYKNPTKNEIEQVLNMISTRLEQESDNNFLLIWVIIGQGIMKEGMQHILFNEYDEHT